jgi:hypothetical protein
MRACVGKMVNIPAVLIVVQVGDWNIKHSIPKDNGKYDYI